MKEQTQPVVFDIQGVPADPLDNRDNPHMNLNINFMGPVCECGAQHQLVVQRTFRDPGDLCRFITAFVASGRGTFGQPFVAHLNRYLKRFVDEKPHIT